MTPGGESDLRMEDSRRVQDVNESWSRKEGKGEEKGYSSEECLMTSPYVILLWFCPICRLVTEIVSVTLRLFKSKEFDVKE